MRFILVLLFGLACLASGLQLQNMFGSRRDFAAAMGTVAGTIVSPEASLSLLPQRNDETASPSSELLSLIPTMDSGAPATDRTIPTEISTAIERFVATMEKTAKLRYSNNKNNIESPLLSGSWRLLYSNAPEIVSLARGLPLGFHLGPTYQPLDTANGFFENTARLDHPYHLAALRTIVVGSIAPAEKGSLNAAGVVNDRNNRVEVRFEVIVFEIDEVFGRRLTKPIRKTLVPSKPSGGTALPGNDQTYLDENLRIVRGGDGSLFVFSRESSAQSPMTLSAKERADLLGSVDTSGSTLTTPVGKDLESEIGKRDNVPVEIQYLYRDQR
mmetsp:Transcript_36003/g.61418  ORF Transcript_36003/g.61418 Transcript_36003/m.61418 type:complete len:328 (+) Transcript_36003:266-1249(+)